VACETSKSFLTIGVVNLFSKDINDFGRKMNEVKKNAYFKNLSYLLKIFYLYSYS
jgi:hypothetical protein